MVGKRIKINKVSEVCDELWGLTGIITTIDEVDNSKVRENYKAYSDRKPCPDETHYRIKFDQPITKEGNFKGWRGMWLFERDYFIVIN